MILSLNKGTFVIYRKDDRFNKVYDSDVEPGLLCDMEDIEDTQYYDDYALPDVPPPDAEKTSLIMTVMNMLQKEGTS